MQPLNYYVWLHHAEFVFVKRKPHFICNIADKSCNFTNIQSKKTVLSLEAPKVGQFLHFPSNATTQGMLQHRVV